MLIPSSQPSQPKTDELLKAQGQPDAGTIIDGGPKPFSPLIPSHAGGNVTSGVPTPEQPTNVTPPSVQPVSPQPLIPPAPQLPTLQPGAQIQPVSATSAPPVAAQPGSTEILNRTDSRETVAGQLDRLLSEDSPLLQSARMRAMEFSTGRGLQNSSMAAQAGEKSVIDSALPIAQQDAAQAHQRVQSFVDTGQKQQLISTETSARAALLAQEGAQRLKEIEAQTDANARLQSMDQAFRLLLEDRAAGHAITLEDRRFQNAMASMIAEYGQRTQLSQVEQLQQLERMNLQHAHTLEQINAQAEASQRTEVGPRLGQQYLAAVSERMAAGSNEIQQIYSTQGLTPQQQQNAVQLAYQRMNTDLAAIGRFYEQSPFWDDRWTPGAGGAGQSPTTPGAGGPIMSPPPGGGIGSPLPAGSGGGPRTTLIRELLR